MRHLTGATLKDRLRILTSLTRHGLRNLERVAASPLRTVRRLRRKQPERLVIAPQDIRTSDPTIAADISAGYFAFGGRIVNAHQRSPFEIESGAGLDDHGRADAAWARQLDGFGWLRHLRAANTPAIRQRGRDLIAEFLAVNGRPAPNTAWEPAVASRRMLAWLSQSPVVLEGADRAFYLRFLQALEAHRAYLERSMSGGLSGADRLLVAVALAEFGLCVQGSGGPQRRDSEILAAEIATQILPDGGHIGRNPQTTVNLLLDLLPLRQAYAARGIQAPQQLLNAIDRMMPMVRLYRHGDGTLALFNGMGVTAPELVATVLAYDDARGRPLTNAPYTGYQRLEGRETLVIVDAGASPPEAFSTQAHAGCLSFELSSAVKRIVVNCGTPETNRAGAVDAARSTAAHSTLVIDDTSSCRFAAGSGLRRWLGDRILAGPAHVAVERAEDEHGTRLVADHDGYVPRFGLTHRRTLALARDGARLDGTDRLVETGKRKVQPVPFVLRFHLHPGVRPRIIGEGEAIRLDLFDGESWLFESEVPAGLEPSILFAATGGPRATTQIKIAANSGMRPEIAWSFRRIGPEPERRAR